MTKQQKKLREKIIGMVENYNKSSMDKGGSLALIETTRAGYGLEGGECLVKDWWSSHCYYEDPAIQWQYDCGLREPEEEDVDWKNSSNWED